MTTAEVESKRGLFAGGLAMIGNIVLDLQTVAQRIELPQLVLSLLARTRLSDLLWIK